MDFFIDSQGDRNLSSTNATASTSSKNSIIKQILEEYKATLLEKGDSSKTIEKKKNIFLNAANDHSQYIDSDSETDQQHIERTLQKAAVNGNFEKLETVPTYETSEKKLKQIRKREADKTKGKSWYGLPATEVTDEIKNNLEVLQMRSVLDPKHFYKKNDLKVLPKYFQVGKVLDSPLEYYNNRVLRKDRKKTLVDELLADAEFNRYNKRKYKEIIVEKQKSHYKAHKRAKMQKRKKT